VIVSHLFQSWLKFIQNNLFFLVLIILSANILWLVFSATYPMPFDEFAHYGAIQVFSGRWLPFVASQPLDSGIIGDITRNPSTLYYWLMSYPYRLFDALFTTDMALIIGLRLINVGLVLGGILLFRKLFLEWKLPNRVVNVALLIFVVTPIVSFLSAHINYDNLLFLFTPLVLLYASRIARSDKQLFANVGLLVLTTLLALATKQTFLPVALVVWLYVTTVLIFRHKKQLLAQLYVSFKMTQKGIGFWLAIVAIALLSVIAVERYGVNLIRYQAIQPQCEEVQPIAFCEQFGPWYRNNVINVINRPAEPPYGNPLSFSQYWVARMYRGYFANFSHTPTVGATDREPYGPIATKPLLPMQSVIGIAALAIGLLAVMLKRREIWKDPMLRFAVIVFVGFIIIQWGYNYSSYLAAWKAEAIQARYTIPVLPLGLLVMASAVDMLKVKRSYKQAGLAIVLLGFVYGGGATGWIIRADQSWRWQNSTVQTVNSTAQGVLTKIVPH
jgi:hypothetical protein